MRLFVVIWFIFCVHYIPFHLAFETHLDDLSARHVCGRTEAAGLAQADHDEGNHHVPHLASDHLLRLLPHAPFSFVDSDVVLVDKSVARFTLESYTGLFLTERQNPPGIPRHDPAQPRAPPLA